MGESPPWRVQNGLGIVLVRSFFRLAVWVRFFDLLRLLLGWFWAASGAVLGLFGPSWHHFGALLGSFSASLGSMFDSWMSLCNLVGVDVRFSLFDVHFRLFPVQFVEAGLGPGLADCALRD